MQKLPEMDWGRFDALSDAEIDTGDIPAPEESALALARLQPALMSAASLVVDGDVYAWFVQSGPDYQRRMNALLRAHMEEAQQQSG